MEILSESVYIRYIHLALVPGLPRCTRFNCAWVDNILVLFAHAQLKRAQQGRPGTEAI